MHTRNRVLSAVLSLLLTPLASTPLFADGDQEVLEPHPMPAYKGSVPASEDGQLERLTKDDLATVRKYFESRLKPGDRIEPFSKDGESGFTVVYTKKVGSRELRTQELRVMTRTDKRPPHQAFGELSAQARSGRHKESEFRSLEKDYADIDSAYFRRVQEDGRTKDEDRVILDRAHREAHPDGEKLKAAGKKNKVSAEDKAEAKELKRKMKELKAQGDIAGMMALAQGSKKFQAPPANQMEAARMAAEDMNRDTWDLWVKCLKDTKKAAYRTRLEYTRGTLN